ncbi:MAG: RdgB/HAM1 family non-canonical purine NTP pyrophosphatase [Elusimicrobiales bacterium]|nr:RdgB/HAM1 family non-canonical purine NTP pyrophosphatase [Elusimicrobiales bacterium]
MEKTLVIATFNRHKTGEILAILPSLRLRLRPLSDFPGAVPAVEDGASLEENALKKAVEAARFTGAWALADDTGLEVDALGGAPGVRSARYAGETASPAQNSALLLASMAEVPVQERTARFACVVALASPDGKTFTARGTLEGAIAGAARGANGFGYDPLFLVGGGPRTLAELSEKEKNGISHRARALAGILPHLALI